MTAWSGKLSTVPEIVNSIGLFLDIVGVSLLFKFGLPAEVKRDGSSGIHFWAIVDENAKESEQAKAKRYDQISYVALSLIVFGFVLQIISNWIRG